jgi:formamidopyrimidine-DNA glycosylase
MPELPEVEALARYLGDELTGRTVERADLATFSALKTFDPTLDALRGRSVESTGRLGKWLLVNFGDDPQPLWLCVHLARGGWVRWKPDAAPPPGRPKGGKSGLALRLVLDGGGLIDITEAGTEKRLAVHVARDPHDVERIAELGVDPLSDEFTPEALGALLKEHVGQIKKVLTDQEVIGGVGNAYSDEALHVAKLSPFKNSSKLSDEEVARLHGAIVGVMRSATERAVGLGASELKGEKKLGLRVHGRKGEACPECGDTIREVSFATSSLQYCATCQTGGKPLADRRLSRLLK